ncbi:MAG TPA: carbohydrate binding family 9 domain-containing protein [Sphingomicrobium sp.]|nr:carbohydrate binding family 9 domain-containing protein [Sphingomicrobium sp.]
MRGPARLALVIVAAAGPVHAADDADLVPQAVEAHRLTGPIDFDGKLDERDWRDAPPLDRLWENYPGNRVPASERTEARFLYDDQYLYVGFRLFLKDPSSLRKPFVRRDKVGSTHDYVQVYLDPQDSGQTSTLFRVNARGTETDGVQDEAKQSESTDPDFEWEVRSATDSKGWTSELRIPLSTLRVSRRGRQVWNVVVTRGVPREQNTQMATAPWPRVSSCFLCLASKLNFPDLTPKAERLIVEPSIVTTLRRERGSFGSGTHFDPQPSLDAKWLPYGGAAVDLTINPDFSQVEADSPQLTANQRFAINLPEKRPFFRESSDLIGTLLPILYTRTITAPDYGLRFTHRSATINGTAFAAVDGGRGVIIEPGLLSSSTGLPDFDSKVGFAHVTDRIGSALVGALGAAKINDDGSYNALGGVDATWQNSADRLTGQILYSSTRDPKRPDLVSSWNGQKLSGIAARAEWDHNGSYVSTLEYTHYAPGFRSWLGFVPRVGYDDLYAYFQRPFYLSSPIVDTLGPYVSFDRLTAIDAEGQEQDPAIGLQVYGLKALSLDLSWHPRQQLLTEQGGERRVGQFRWNASIQPSLRLPLVSFSGAVGRDADYAAGDTARLLNLAATVRARPLDRLELEARYTLLRLGDAPDGGFRLKETIPEFLATWFFGPAFYAFADVQVHRSRRRFPFVADDRTTLASLQFVWEPKLDWRGYFGVRSGRDHPLDPKDRGSSTELYVKLVRRLAI